MQPLLRGGAGLMIVTVSILRHFFPVNQVPEQTGTCKRSKQQWTQCRTPPPSHLPTLIFNSESMRVPRDELNCIYHIIHSILKLFPFKCSVPSTPYPRAYSEYFLFFPCIYTAAVSYISPHRPCSRNNTGQSRLHKYMYHMVYIHTYIHTLMCCILHTYVLHV